MLCRLCRFPILKVVALEEDEDRRILGCYCTHCRAKFVLEERIVSGPEVKAANVNT
jgi:hypothetical protein